MRANMASVIGRLSARSNILRRGIRPFVPALVEGSRGVLLARPERALVQRLHRPAMGIHAPAPAPQNVSSEGPDRQMRWEDTLAEWNLDRLDRHAQARVLHALEEAFHAGAMTERQRITELLLAEDSDAFREKSSNGG